MFKVLFKQYNLNVSLTSAFPVSSSTYSGSNIPVIAAWTSSIIEAYITKEVERKLK